jgi:hypothetical protein
MGLGGDDDEEALCAEFDVAGGNAAELLGYDNDGLDEDEDEGDDDDGDDGDEGMEDLDDGKCPAFHSISPTASCQRCVSNLGGDH